MLYLDPYLTLTKHIKEAYCMISEHGEESHIDETILMATYVIYRFRYFSIELSPSQAMGVAEFMLEREKLLKDVMVAASLQLRGELREKIRALLHRLYMEPHFEGLNPKPGKPT